MRYHVVVLSIVAPFLALVTAVPQASASACAPPPSRQGPLASVTALPSSASPVAADTRIGWTRWSSRVLYGQSAVLHGQVVTEDGAIADADVELYAREASASEWISLGSAYTDPDTGVFAFDCLQPTMTTAYRVVYEGSPTYQATQAERTVRVLRRVPDALAQVAAERFRLSGSVQPRYAERRVLLQHKDCRQCRWRTVQRKQTNSRSRWGFTIDASGHSGSRWFRAVVPADQFYTRSYGYHVWRITR